MRARWAIAVAAAVVAAGCEPRSRTVVVQNDVEPAAAAEVFVGGASIGVKPGPEWTFDVPATVGGRRMLPPRRDPASITVKMPTACGEQTFCVAFPQDAPGGPSMPGGGAPLIGSLAGRLRGGACASDTLALWVDDRGGPVRVLSVGSAFHATIVGGAVDRIDVMAPACAKEARVALDGVTVGELPIAGGSGKIATDDIWLDAVGGRCYVFNDIDFHAPHPADWSPFTSFLRGARLYRLSNKLNRPFVKVPRTANDVHGTELLDVECGAAR